MKGLSAVATRRRQVISVMAAACAWMVLSVSPAAGASNIDTVQGGTLTVGTDLTYPPYAYFHDKVPSGFDPDFSRMMAQSLGLKTTILDTRFADLILGLKANRFDMVASALYVTPERAKILDYVPYLKTGSSLLVLRGAKVMPVAPEDLCGLKVSSIKAASWTPKLGLVSAGYCAKQGKGPIQVLEFPTSPEALLALRSKGADAMMEDAAVAHQMARDMKDLEVSSKGLIYPIVIGLGVNKSKPELRDALSAALKKATESGNYQALLKRYGLEAPTAQDVEESLHPKTASGS